MTCMVHTFAQDTAGWFLGSFLAINKKDDFASVLPIMPQSTTLRLLLDHLVNIIHKRLNSIYAL